MKLKRRKRAASTRPRRKRYPKSDSDASRAPDDRWTCYLIEQASTPRVPRTPQAYIGVTLNLARRLAQHGGRLVGGARRTSAASAAGATWRLVATVRGFRSKHDILSFEWVAHRRMRRRTQRPTAAEESVAVLRELAAWPKWGGGLRLELEA